MFKNLQILLIVTLTVILTGCAGLAHEAEGEHLERLDPAVWPTPKPGLAAASPTAFPKAILPPATPTPNNPPEPATATAATTEPVVEPAASSIISNLPLNPSAIISKFPVIATGVVAAPEAAIRQGPGSNYGAISRIEPGDVFGILGVNSTRDWVYLIDASLSPGWMPVNQLRVLGSLEQAPVLPPNPIAYFAQQAGISLPGARPNGETSPASPAASESDSESPPASQPVATANLKAITTATVQSEALHMRKGAGGSFEKVATLAQNEKVSILAVNPPKDWVLVERANQQQGWVDLGFLALAGSLADAPVISPETLSQPTTADPVVVTANQNSVTAEPAAFGDLGPIAQGRLAGLSAPLRPGPSLNDAPIGELKLTDEVIDILGVDSTGQWLLVQPVSTQIGWVARDDLKIEGALSAAPQVFSAWVSSNAVETRQGPAIYKDAVGVLAINSLVAVMGLDKSQSWALVKPIPAGSAAWAPINFLKPGGTWASLPTVKGDALPPAAVGAASPPALASLPPAKDLLVIQRSSGGDILLIKPDGSGLRRLTTGIDPVLSPDGQTIAFTRWQGETGSLWLINVDGSKERLVLDNIKQAKGADWSPNGQQIVLNFQQGGRLDFKQECKGVEAGSRPRPPRNARDFEFKLNDDFEPELCYTIPPDEHWMLKVIDLPSQSFKDVDGGTYAFRPAWDPQQAWRIVSDGGRGLLELDVNRDYRQAITDEVGDGSPVFSPDGRFMAVSLGREGGGQGYDLFRLNADGSGRLRLTETPLWASTSPTGGKLWNNVAPAWSPDAGQIAFLTDRTGHWEIWVMNSDGSNQHPLFSDEVNEQLQLTYNFVDERMVSWR
jgi:uncharacterized protein YgiM (DUF1202 family)